MRSHSHLNTAQRIIDSYHGEIPFAAWLKHFFSQEKKYGSKDRKAIAHACYCYYRLGKAFAQLDVQERILLGLFLCSSNENLTLKELRPDWSGQIHLSVHEKMVMVAGGDVTFFPWIDQLSPEIDREAFNLSFLIQPDLFLRTRPGKKQNVEQKLKNAGVDFKMEGEGCLRLDNQTKTDAIITADYEAVVQDYNSQKVMDDLSTALSPGASRMTMWDCCAASGGKSILFHDHFPTVAITVSDIRESILANLKRRFQSAGIERFQSFTADVSSDQFNLAQKFDVVICDAPCSGSGTWSRTPEQLLFFQTDRIAHYADLQKKILINAARRVKPSGYLLYITCSVFAEENERVVESFLASSPAALISSRYLKGYDQKADTLFVTLFRL